MLLFQLDTSVQWVPGYKTRGPTALKYLTAQPLRLRPCAVCRSSVLSVESSVFLAVVELGRGKDGDLYATVQGLGDEVVFLFGVVSP